MTTVVGSSGMARVNEEQGGESRSICFAVHPPLPVRARDGKRARNRPPQAHSRAQEGTATSTSSTSTRLSRGTLSLRQPVNVDEPPVAADGGQLAVGREHGVMQFALFLVLGELLLRGEAPQPHDLVLRVGGEQPPAVT